jgi:hypothetical protein
MQRLSTHEGLSRCPDPDFAPRGYSAAFRIGFAGCWVQFM